MTPWRSSLPVPSLRREFHSFGEGSRIGREQAKERSIKRRREAVGSSRLDAVIVTNTTLKWLKAEKLVDKDNSVQSAVETLIDLIRKEHAIGQSWNGGANGLIEGE